MTAYDVQIVFTEPLLASSPASPEVYARYIQSRRAQADNADELLTLSADETEKAGWSVFHQDETGLFLYDYKLKGFLKEAASALTGKGMTAYKSKIDKWVFIQPRRLYLMDGDGAVIREPQGVVERPIRAMTMQGPRVTVKRSDSVPAGTKFNCKIVILPLGVTELTRDRIAEWLDYGRLMGMGEWRTGSYGRFESTLNGAEGGQ